MAIVYVEINNDRYVLSKLFVKPRVVAPDRILSMSRIVLFDI